MKRYGRGGGTEAEVLARLYGYILSCSGSPDTSSSVAPDSFRETSEHQRQEEAEQPVGAV